MVGQERQRAVVRPLEWREVCEFDASVSRYWELVHAGSDPFFAAQYATVYKMAKRKWELRIPRIWTSGELAVDVSIHKTLSAAKAVGIVLVRFNQSTN